MGKENFENIFTPEEQEELDDAFEGAALEEEGISREDIEKFIEDLEQYANDPKAFEEIEELKKLAKLLGPERSAKIGKKFFLEAIKKIGDESDDPGVKKEVGKILDEHNYESLIEQEREGI